MISQTGRYPALIPWAFALIIWALMTGCTTAGLYGADSQHLDDATRALSSKDFSGAEKAFSTLARDKTNPDAVAAGEYGLTCLAMASAKDIPSFLSALETLSRFPDARRFEKQNPVLLLTGVENGIRLMEKKQAEQTGQIRRLREERARAGKQNDMLEQTLKNLRYQLREIERIDKDLQEKRNPS